MRVRLALIGSPLFLALLAYGLSPYVTLWRLGGALRDGDAHFIASHVDWNSVRQGMVEQVDSEIRGAPAPGQPAADDLPAFGASFANHLAHNVVDHAFHPDQVEAALRQLAITGGSPDVSLRWAFFEGVDRFLVAIAMPCHGRTDVMQVHLQVHDGRWRVMKVVAAPELLASFSTHT